MMNATGNRSRISLHFSMKLKSFIESSLDIKDLQLSKKLVLMRPQKQKRDRKNFNSMKVLNSFLEVRI